eukprot:4112921-Pleurochrysis_carterae.AAC.2
MQAYAFANTGTHPHTHARAHTRALTFRAAHTPKYKHAWASPHMRARALVHTRTSSIHARAQRPAAPRAHALTHTPPHMKTRVRSHT